MNLNNKNYDTVKGIIDLYTKIPNYSEVKHLGNSEFINKIEKLKEEFREIRSTLYEDSEDIDWLSESTKKALHLSPSPKTDKNVPTRALFKVTNEIPKKKHLYLSIKGCEIHRPPSAASASVLKPVTKYFRPTTAEFSKSNPNINLSNQNYNNQYTTKRGKEDDSDDKSESNYGSSGSGSLSRWSLSEDDISTFHRFDYNPPQNIEQRLQIIKSLSRNKSQKEPPASPIERFRTNVHPVPSHVHKPLFNEIMLQNKKRSQKVREQSKQKLMAQVKPFTFSKPSWKSHGRQSGESSGTQQLNNSRGIKAKKISLKGSTKINNDTTGESSAFKAHPAPPRRRAIMAALRLKEQQEYRDLKKQLRAEALMKMSSLPPGMAARNKLNYSQFKGSWPCVNTKQNKEIDSRWDTFSTFTDEDRVSEDSFVSNKSNPTNNRKKSEKIKSKKNVNASKSFSQTLSRLNKSGVFESTANDNIASRLRVQAAKKKESERIRRDKEEQNKLFKNEEQRYKLRHMHSDVWRRACSYSSSQDIAMRRQLRIAASILERDSFQKDMSNMLSRVRSAPLLLEGERRSELCKKHQQEIMQIASKSPKPHRSTPLVSAFGPEKYYSRINWTSHGDENGDCGGGGTSETAAMAEGSTTSDNESVKDIQSDEEIEKLKMDPDTFPVENEKINSKDYVDEAIEIEKAADEIIGFEENDESACNIPEQDNLN